MKQIGVGLTRRTFTGWTMGFAMAPLMANVGRAQVLSWPTQPVRLITPSAPGSSTDFAARAYAERLTARWSKPVIVEARTGAQGAIAVNAVLERAGDEHTLLFSPTGIVTVTPLLRKSPPFDPAALVPISLSAIDYLTVAASVESGFIDLKGLVEAARRHPGKLNVAAGLGGPTLALLNFLHRHKLDVAQIPYRSPPDAIGDLTAGRIQLLIGPLAPMLSLARTGKVRLLAVTNPERTPIASEVPTALEQGFDELTFEGSLGVFGPARMNSSMRGKIAEDMKAAANDASLIESFQGMGLVPRAESGDRLVARLSDQTLHWRKVIQATGFEAPG